MNASIKHPKDCNSTSPEEDIPALFIKIGGTELQTYLVKLFNMSLKEGKLPKEFLFDHKIERFIKLSFLSPQMKAKTHVKPIVQ